MARPWPFARPTARGLLASLAVAALLALAFAVQAAFYRRFPQPVLFGDPAGYFAIGQSWRTALAGWRAGGSLGAALDQVRGSFEFLGIGLLFALLPSDRPGDLAAFRLLLTGFNTVGMLGACLLARRLSGSLLAGLLAIAVATLHPSFSCDTGRLFPEPVVGCLSVWAAYFLVRGLDERRPGWMGAAGLALSGALFVRAKLMPYLVALMLLALLASLPAWRRQAGARRMVLALLLGGLPLFALWFGARRVAAGPVDSKVPEWNLPARQYYPYGFWQYLDSDGWEGPYRLKTEPYYQALQAAARDQPELLRSRRAQLLFTARYVAGRPWLSLSTVLDNAWRLYDHPHNPYHWDYPLDGDEALLLHRLVVVLGLAGALLAALRQPARAAAFFVPLALPVVYGLAFPYPRYALPGLLILVASASAWCVTVAGALARPGARALSRPLLVLALGLALAALGRLAFLAAPESARAAALLGLAALLGAPLLLSAALVPEAPRRWALAALAFGLLLLPGAAHAARDRNWHETETELSGSGARQEIELDEQGLAALRAASQAFVAFDLSVPRGDVAGLTLSVGGRTFAGSLLQPAMPRFPEQTTTGGRDWRGHRQWWVLPLDPAWLPAPGQPLVIELRAAAGSGVRLRGDRFAGQDQVYEGPSFGDWPWLASSKLEHQADYRLDVRRPLESRATRSLALSSDGRWRPCRQRFRVRLVTLGQNEGRLAWRTPPLPKAGWLALAFAGSSLGRGLAGEVWLGEARLRGFPLASAEDFVVEQPPLRLCFRAGGRRGEQEWGSYVLVAPATAPGESLPMGVRFLTGLRDEPATFSLDTRPGRPRLEPPAACALPAGAALVEAFGGALQADRNTYPADTGRWRVERVF